MERVLVIVKPDGMERALVGKILDSFEGAGLKIVGIRMLRPSEDLVKKHYTDDEDWLLSVGAKTRKSYVEKGVKVKETDKEIGIKIRSMLIRELTRMPVIAAVFEGNSAAEVARKIAGGTEPRRADPYSLRGRFSSDSYELADIEKRPVRNIVHVSENAEIAEKEIKVWFTEKELFKYDRIDWKALY